MLIYPEKFDQKLKAIVARSEIKAIRNTYSIFREFSVYALAGIRTLTDRSGLPAKRFFVLCQCRTGSTLLMRLLNSNPNICTDEEILYLKTCFPKHYVNAKSSLSRKENYGFKMPTGLLVHEQKIANLKQFIFKLHQEGWFVIYLRRRDILRQALSKAISSQRLVWHHDIAAKSELKLGKIHVNWDIVKDQIDRAKILSNLEADMLDKISYHSIIYEDALLNEANHQETCNAITAYLGLAPSQVKAPLEKISPYNFSDFILNINEGQKKFKDTEYESLCSELLK